MRAVGRAREVCGERVGRRLCRHGARRERQPLAVLHRAAGGRDREPAALPRPGGDPHRLVALARPLARDLLARLSDEDGALAAARQPARPAHARGCDPGRHRRRQHERYDGRVRGERGRGRSRRSRSCRRSRRSRSRRPFRGRAGGARAAAV